MSYDINEDDRPENDHQRGITLRDYFAGQALAGMHAYGLDNFISNGVQDRDAVVAQLSYEAADAMLGERKKCGEPHEL